VIGRPPESGSGYAFNEHPSKVLISFNPSSGISSEEFVDPPQAGAGAGAVAAGALPPLATLGLDQRYGPNHRCHQDTNVI